MSPMINKCKALILAIAVLLIPVAVLRSAPAPLPPNGPEYTNNDQLKRPENYRQ